MLLLCSSKNIKSLRLLQSLIGLGEWIAIIPKLVCSLLLRVLLHWLLELSRRRSGEHVLLLISEWISSLLGLYLLWLDRNVSFCLSERDKICGCRLQLGKLLIRVRSDFKLLWRLLICVGQCQILLAIGCYFVWCPLNRLLL